jgi:hypothetical protein
MTRQARRDAVEAGVGAEARAVDDDEQTSATTLGGVESALQQLDLAATSTLAASRALTSPDRSSDSKG